MTSDENDHFILQWRLNVQRDLGALDADLKTVKSEVINLRTDIAEIKKILNQRAGGWKMLAAIAGVSASIGGLLVSLLGNFIKGF